MSCGQQLTFNMANFHAACSTISETIICKIHNRYVAKSYTYTIFSFFYKAQETQRRNPINARISKILFLNAYMKTLPGCSSKVPSYTQSIALSYISYFIVHRQSPAHSAQPLRTYTSHKTRPLEAQKYSFFVVFFTKKISTNVIDISGFTAYYRGSS